jgi:hypothetical protein
MLTKETGKFLIVQLSEKNGLIKIPGVYDTQEDAEKNMAIVQRCRPEARLLVIAQIVDGATMFQLNSKDEFLGANVEAILSSFGIN